MEEHQTEILKSLLVYTRPLSITNLHSDWLLNRCLFVMVHARVSYKMKLTNYFENYGVIAVYRLFSQNFYI